MTRFIRKSWYTLTEAADYLTQNNPEGTQDTVSYLLQLAAEGQLTLTLRLFSDTLAARGQIALVSDFLPEELTLGDFHKTWRTCTPCRVTEASEFGLDSAVHIAPVQNCPVYFIAREDDATVATIKSSYWSLTHHGAGARLMEYIWRQSYEPAQGNSRPESLAAFIQGMMHEHELNKQDGSLFLWPYPDDGSGWEIKIEAPNVPESTLLGVAAEDLERLLWEHRSDLPTEGIRQAPASDEQLPEELNLLTTGWRKFWKNASRLDKSSWPLKADVVTWFKEQGLKANRADSAAFFISPVWARAGGAGRRKKTIPSRL